MLCSLQLNGATIMKGEYVGIWKETVVTSESTILAFSFIEKSWSG
jgi:hypothetical protein